MIDKQEWVLLSNLGILPEQLEGTADELSEILTKRIADYDNAYEKGVQEVSDTLYDNLRAILKKIKPEAEILDSLYSEDYNEIDEDRDRYLLEVPFKSIKTIKSMSELNDFMESLQGLCSHSGKKTVECIASLKINGHAGRSAVKDGVVISASTRGRSKKGRDVTEHLSNILSDEILANLKPYGFVELRGEIALQKERLADARKFNPNIKSVFTAVSSLMKPSATVEELRLLDFIAYDIYGDNIPDFKTLGDKFEFLEGLGFITPTYTFEDVAPYLTFYESIEGVLEFLGGDIEEYAYDTDGVVFGVNNIEDFRSLGSENSTNNGNVALKMGYWQQEVYSSTIEKIVLCYGKSKVTPKAVIEPVVVGNGSTVRNVPLYNLAALEILEAYEGEILHFKYGGESGVIPCDIRGREIGTLYNILEISKGY